MDRLEWAIDLIKEAQRERRYAAAMQAEIDKISIYDPDYWEKHREVARKFPRTPDSELIAHNLRLARRVLRDECI